MFRLVADVEQELGLGIDSEPRDNSDDGNGWCFIFLSDTKVLVDIPKLHLSDR
jgi:hypothetical protein